MQFPDWGIMIASILTDYILDIQRQQLTASDTSFPMCPVKTSATWKGWERNFMIFLALATVNLSSSDNSSIPRIAMIS